MKLIVRILLVFVFIIAALGITIAVVVIPPSPLIPPKQGLTLENVTWIVPGQSRASNQRIVVKGSFITEVEPHEEHPAHGAASDAAQAADFFGAFVMLVMLGKYEEAIKCYEAALGLRSGWPFD